MRLLYPAIFTPVSNGKGYIIVFPDLPECASEGNSIMDAIDKGTDAACEWILGEIFDRKEIPSPTPYEEIIVEEGSFKNLLIIDIGTYAEKHEEKAVRKCVTIPAWLNTYAEKKKLNFSKVLQEALMELLQK